jgi:hypothetical protein
MTRPPRSIAALLTSVSRLIQFRSELAILLVLAAAVIVGLAVRELLPVRPGPSASIAAPVEGAVGDAGQNPTESRPAPPAPPASAGH